MSVSIVMPVYNEEEVIEKVIRQYYAEIITKIDNSEFIIVDDGSTDATPEILQQLAKEFTRLEIISLAQNNGHSKALRMGFSRVSNPLIFHVDSDDQFKAEYFWKLYRLVEKNDIVLGWRIPRHDPGHRKIISLLLRIINVAIFGALIKDINSPFKFIKTSVLCDIIDDIPPDPFAISILILLAAKYKGYSIAEVPVAHFARTTGKSKLTSSYYLFKGCFSCFCDILLLRKHLLCKKTITSNGNAARVSIKR